MFGLKEMGDHRRCSEKQGRHDIGREHRRPVSRDRAHSVAAMEDREHDGQRRLGEQLLTAHGDEQETEAVAEGRHELAPWSIR